MVKIIFLLIYYVGRGHTHNGQFVSPKNKNKKRVKHPPPPPKKYIYIYIYIKERVLMSDVIENNGRKSNININACLSMTF